MNIKCEFAYQCKSRKKAYIVELLTAVLRSALLFYTLQLSELACLVHNVRAMRVRAQLGARAQCASDACEPTVSPTPTNTHCMQYNTFFHFQFFAIMFLYN